jgi:flagellin-like protein
MVKKLQANRRGLSPIFATLIILAVVTVLFIPVFIWASGLTSSTQDSWQTSGVAATERIVIEEVSLSSGASPQSCIIYVRNIGETAVTINNVIITLADGSAVHAYQKLPSIYPSVTPPITPAPQLSTYDPQPTTPPKQLQSIVKGDLIEISIPNIACMDLSFQITPDQAYTIKVFTTRGVGDSYQVVA